MGTFRLHSTLKLNQDLFILCSGWRFSWEILKNRQARSVTLATEAEPRIGSHHSVPEPNLHSQRLPAGGSTLFPAIFLPPPPSYGLGLWNRTSWGLQMTGQCCRPSSTLTPPLEMLLDWTWKKQRREMKVSPCHWHLPLCKLPDRPLRFLQDMVWLDPSFYPCRLFQRPV